MRVQVHIELDREEDGRWIAEAIELPGVMAYGASREDAITQVTALSLRVLAERVEHHETPFASTYDFDVRDAA